MALANLKTLTDFTPLSVAAITRNTNANLMTDIASLQALSANQLKGLQVWYLANALYSMSGHDYRTTLETLIENTSLLLGGLTPSGVPSGFMNAARTAVAYNLSQTASGIGNSTTVSASPEASLTNVRKTITRDEDTLDRMIFTLEYLISNRV